MSRGANDSVAAPTQLLFGAAVVALAGASVAILGESSIPLILTFGIVGVVMTAAVIRPASLLLVYVVALPFHLAFLVALFNAGVDHSVIRVAGTWKEVTACLMLWLLLVRQISAPRSSPLRTLDVLMGGYLLLNVAYLALVTGSAEEVNVLARLHGFRDNAFFVILYFVGRLAPVTIKELRLVFSAAIALGLLGVIVGLFERFFLPLSFFFEVIHFDAFTRDYLNLHFYTGIPPNFWTAVGNIRRAVSFHLGSHQFALAGTFLLPVVLCLEGRLRPFPRMARGALAGVLSIGILLPLTRSVLVAALAQVMIISWFKRRPHWTIASGAAVILLLGFSWGRLGLSEYMSSVVTYQAGSSEVSHVESWVESVDVVRRNPLGVGFGVVGEASVRSGASGRQIVQGGEGEYSLTAVQIGIPGLLLFLAVHAGAVWALIRAWKRAPAGLSDFPLLVLAQLAGFLIVGILTMPRHVPSFMYPMWWLIGTAVWSELESASPRLE